MTWFALLALPFAASAAAALLPARARNAAASGAALVALAVLVQVALLYPQVREGGVVREALSWLPGISIGIRIDGFAWMFALLVAGIGLLVVLYARYYMSADDPVPRFFAFFLAVMGAMLGIVVSGNLIQLVFFWELTSLFSCLLIGYWQHRKDARRGARMALIVTGTGGLALLAGVLLIGRSVGSYELDVVLASRDRLQADPLFALATVLVLLGALTKSAQFPFHFWLPQAMAAPTPVSAYLHSATLVKAGVFLLARLWPVLAGTSEWFWIVGGAGLLTLLLGAYAAMFQQDLKGLLAYSTISHLGLITLLLGLNSPLAAVAAVFHMLNHATFKASLFMAAGIADHETGTRDLRRLGGLYRAMPITATLALVASAAMAGVPLLNGFLSKEMFFSETVFIASTRAVEIALPAAATLAGMFTVVYALRCGVDVSFATPHGLPRQPHEPPFWMRAPIALLVLVCLVVGIAPAWSVGTLLAAAARPVVGGTLPTYDLVVWHGFNAPFAMSLVALAGGGLLWLAFRRPLRDGRFARVPLIHRLDGKRAFDRILALASLGARHARGALATARLQPQLFWLLSIATLAGALAFSGAPLRWGDRPRVPAQTGFVLLWLVGMACAIGAATRAKYHRLAALVMLGGAGLATGLTFVWFSAPDLALTQLTVEVVTTVLFLLGLRWLPKRVEDHDARGGRLRLRRARDFVLALAAGSGLAALAYAMLTRQAPQSISPFYIERALPEGGGANIVNVMLVDFRSLDTLGEITVLGAVALTVYALLRRFRPPRESIVPPAQQRRLPADIDTDLLRPQGDDGAAGYLLVPAVLVRLLLPIGWLVAVYLFLRGHDRPGGGFVAGLVVAITYLTQYIVAGTQWVEAHARLHPTRWIGNGLLAALLTGLGALALGYPFLTTHTAHVELPLLGPVHLPSALLFDLGVFAAVVGSTLLVLIALAHQSIRSPRAATAAARLES